MYLPIPQPLLVANLMRSSRSHPGTSSPLTLTPKPPVDERQLRLVGRLAAELPADDRRLHVLRRAQAKRARQGRPRLPPQARDNVGRQVHGGRPGQVRRRILERQRQLQLLAQRVRVADLRLPEQRDRVQSLEVEPDRLGFGIGERRPRLADDPAVGLHEGVAETERVLAAGEVALDEGPDRRALERRAQVDAES